MQSGLVRVGEGGGDILRNVIRGSEFKCTGVKRSLAKADAAKKRTVEAKRLSFE